jgi:hypothetical protein
VAENNRIELDFVNSFTKIQGASPKGSGAGAEVLPSAEVLEDDR